MDRQSRLIESRWQECRVHREETDPRKEATMKIGISESRSMELPRCRSIPQHISHFYARHVFRSSIAASSLIRWRSNHRQWWDFSEHVNCTDIDTPLTRCIDHITRADLEGIMFQGIRSSRETSLLHTWANRLEFSFGSVDDLSSLTAKLLIPSSSSPVECTHLDLRKFDPRLPASSSAPLLLRSVSRSRPCSHSIVVCLAYSHASAKFNLHLSCNEWPWTRRTIHYGYSESFFDSNVPSCHVGIVVRCNSSIRHTRYSPQCCSSTRIRRLSS